MRIKTDFLLKSVGFDMTPMIDCVFQVIIFFMLTVDFTNRAVEALELPKALTAKEDKTPPNERLMVNLVHEPDGECDELKYDNNKNLLKPCRVERHWKIKVDGKPYQPAELEALLIKEGGKYQGREPSHDGKLGISNRPLMIRCDAGGIYKLLEKVFTACARARIWKIEIGASKPAGAKD